MAKKKVARVEPAAEAVSGSQRVVGKVVLTALGEVHPNKWNPNKMTDFMKESLKVGLTTDGWLASQALLIWGLDDKGERHDDIIDGEHRWTIASELGFKAGPMVFLDGLNEAQAKALTVKMNMKRGEFDPGDLGALIRSIQYDLEVGSLALDLGIETQTLAGYLIEPEKIGPLEPVVDAEPLPAGKTPHVKMVQLFFNEEQHEKFMADMVVFSKKFKKKNVTDTVMEVMRHG